MYFYANARRSLWNGGNFVIEYHVHFMPGVLHMSKENASEILGSVIASSVQSNAFTTQLQNLARGFGVSSLYYASSDGASYSLVVNDHWTNPAAKRLLTTIYICIAVSVICFIISTLFCCFRSRITSIFSVNPQPSEGPEPNSGVKVVELP